MTKQTRAATFEQREANAKAREVPVVVSTETPVDRGDYVEILDHSPAGVDLSRAPLPLIESHDTGRLNIGVVDELRVEDGKLRGIARFGSSKRALEVFQDVVDGIVRNISIGYEQLAGTPIGKNTVRFRFRPYEVSAVSVPADPQAGFFRSESTPHIQTFERKQMEAQQAEGDRVKAIVDLGEQFKKFLREGDVREALNSGRSVEQFKEQILVRMESKAADVSTRSVGMTQAEVNRYSLARALQASVTGDWTKAGFEREASRALERASAQTAEGFFVPSEIWGRRNFNVGTSSEAGNLVATDLRSDLFTDALRERMVLGQLGVRIVSGLTGNVDIPRKSVAGTLGMLSEIGSASETQPTTAKVTLSPKRIAAYVEVSKQALIQSALPLEAMLRDDLLMGAASLIENQCFNGVGSNNEFLGLRYVSGIGTATGGANGAAVAWSHYLDLEAACANANAFPGAQSGYVINTKTLNKSKQVVKSTYLDFIIPSDTAPDGAGMLRANNRRLAVTNFLPSNLTKGTSTTICSAALFSSDWSMAVLGLFGAPDIVVDPYSLAATGQVRITLNQFADMVVRQPAAIAKIEDLLTA